MVQQHDVVIGGVDTHRDVHVAAVIDGVGRLLGTESFASNSAGYRALSDWMGSFGPVVVVGVEGTGSYGVGLASYLRRNGHRGQQQGGKGRKERKTRAHDGACVPAARLPLSKRKR